jgi:arylformamidase
MTGSSPATSTTAGPGALGDLLASSRLVDLTHVLEEGMPTYPTHAKYFHNYWQSMGDPAQMHQLVLSEHTGTHMDAPSHFPDRPDAATVADLDPGCLLGRAVTIHLGPFQPDNATVDAQIIIEWERTHTSIRAGDVVLLDFGWGRQRWATGEAGFAHLDGWPGMSRSAAELLAARHVKAVGTDCVSGDSGDGGGGELPAHRVLLPAGILIIENLANLDALPDTSFFAAFPLRIANGTGSPIRAVALLPGT